MELLDIDQIIQELNKPYDGVLPERALRAAQERRQDIVPRLMDLIRNATEVVRTGGTPACDGHLLALYLLAEFRAAEALPAILDAIALPDDGPFTMFGDAITDDLSRILVSCAADPLVVIDRLIADRALNEYVRWEAAQTYLLLVRDGKLTRDEAVARLRGHLRQAIATRDSTGAGIVVAELICYSPREAAEDIEEAFRQDLVDPSLADSESVAESIDQGDTRFQKELESCHPSHVQDTVAELRQWASFQPRRPITTPAPVISTPVVRPVIEPSWKPAVSGPNKGRRVGRNDPCPCGSGKKFKKCCLPTAGN